jgi:putative flavoprotein involved in K+ transport
MMEICEMGVREVAVVGAGQAGLATSYHLARRGIDHVVLESASRVGESWRGRWESLRLFTPAQFDGLPGLRFPGRAGTFPSRDEFVSYLETYVRSFELPIRFNTRVTRLSREGAHYHLETQREDVVANQVVIASGAYQTARTPEFARNVTTDVRQLHAIEYRNPAQLQAGSVLVAGAGNSGAEIAMEAALAGHETWLAGRATGEIPPRMYAFNGAIFWFLANHVFSVHTPIGRRMQSVAQRSGGPLIRLTMKDVLATGVKRVGRVVGVSGGRPLLDEGDVLDVANIVWCTGFGNDFSWIEVPALTGDGRPDQRFGAARNAPGLYFVGLHFLTKLASAFIGGVGGDAARVAEMIRHRAAPTHAAHNEGSPLAGSGK